jgi:hypothetical protein
MNSRLFGLLGAALVGITSAGCKSDPTADLAGSGTRLAIEFSYREVVVADSVRTFAAVYDGLNSPVVAAITVRSLNTAIATVSPVSDDPLARQGFFVHGVTYGTTKVVAEGDGFADTMDVATFASKIVVSGQDSVISGATRQYSFAYFAADNNDITGQGIPAPAWRTNDANRGTTTQAGLLSGFDPGVVTLTAVSPRGPGNDSVRNAKVVFVDPKPFVGTTNALTSTPTDTVRFARSVGARRFNLDSSTAATGLRATFKFVAIPTFIARRTADSLYVIVPPIGDTTTNDLVITRADSGKTAEKVSYKSSTASLLDHQDPASDDPATATVISANGDYYVVLHGTCTGGVFTNPGDDCDDFYAVTNPGGASDSMRVQLDWLSAADVDVLWCRNPACSSVTTGGGATAANPEISRVFIPAGATWYLWINLFDPAGTKSSFARIRLSGKGVAP